MRVLLDTHALLWFLTDPDRLSRFAYASITAPTTEVLVSVASLWEITLKLSIGKLTLDEPFENLLPAQLAAERIEVLPIAMSHLAALRRLPFHHRDPFDRLLIAQAIAEGLSVVSRDAAFASYDVDVLWNEA